MDWNAVAAIGEAVGAFAVVISVVYLALQVRKNTRESIVNMVQDTIKEFSKVAKAVATTPDLASIIVRGNKGLENLSPDEQLRFDGYNSMFFAVMEAWHTQSRRIPVDSEQEELIRTMLINQLADRGCQQWWQETQEQFPPGFCIWVDENANLK